MQPTKANLKRIAEKAGATLEEDLSFEREERIFQVVAPDGFHWDESDSYHLLVRWEIANPACAFEDAVARIKSGMHVMTAEERYLAGED